MCEGGRAHVPSPHGEHGLQVRVLLLQVVKSGVPVVKKIFSKLYVGDLDSQYLGSYVSKEFAL